MAKIIIKDGQISSSAGISIPGNLSIPGNVSISGNVILGDNFTDTLTVNANAIFNDDLTVIDTISSSFGRFTVLTGSIITGSTARFTAITGSNGYIANNLGLGTINPQRTLDINGSVNDFAASIGVTSMAVGQWTGLHFGYREDNNDYRKSAIVFERTDGAARGKIHILNDSAADAGSATLADTKLTIDENGNVGIGTSNPGTLLTVSGTISVLSGSIYGQVAELTSSTTNYTLVKSDSGKFLNLSASTGINLTIPSGLPNGFTVTFCQVGAGQITVVTSGVTLNNRQTHTKTAGQYSVASLISIAADVYVFAGDTAA